MNDEIENSGVYMKVERIQIFSMVAIFGSSLFALVFIIGGVGDLETYFSRNEYKSGIFIIESFYCGTGEGTDGSNCTGYGKVNNIKTSVVLGLSPSNQSVFSKPFADLNKDQYQVFYRLNGKKTILNTENKEKLDTTIYLKDGLLLTLIPISIMSILIVIYKRTTKKLKQIKNEE